MNTNTPEQLIPDLVLTEKAIEWVITYIDPICGTDFLGYIFNINDIFYPKKYRDAPGIAVDWQGRFRIFSINKLKPILSSRNAKKWIKKLHKLKFIERDIIPFPEFDSRYNLPIDSDKVVMIEEPLF